MSPPAKLLRPLPASRSAYRGIPAAVRGARAQKKTPWPFIRAQGVLQCIERSAIHTVHKLGQLLAEVNASRSCLSLKSGQIYRPGA